MATHYMKKVRDQIWPMGHSLLTSDLDYPVRFYAISNQAHLQHKLVCMKLNMQSWA